ncbi:hypothetical protein [Bacillus safensis]|uniref:hypothetical protein n=1 Tax=Bacillus safensis TaxID=561879 RepID=UPI002E2177B4|nr:hypothetical protein [Bacillus safensis]
MKEKLYELLLQKGVADAHIKEMKATLNCGIRLLLLYYRERKTIECEVPLNKIKSLGYRGSSGLSWYDHAAGKGINIDPRRNQIAHDHLLEQPLEKFHTYYKKEYVRLIYFADLDFYAVFGDGTHRTLWAKITGSSTIRAEVTIAYKDHREYELFMKKYKHSFKIKAIVQWLMNSTPNKVESIFLAAIRGIYENKSIKTNEFGMMRVGLELYYIQKVLSNEKNNTIVAPKFKSYNSGMKK